MGPKAATELPLSYSALKELRHSLERKTRKQQEKMEARMENLFLPEPIAATRMTEIIAPQLHAGVVLGKKLAKKVAWGFRNRRSNWTIQGQNLDSAMMWTQGPNRYTRTIVAVRLQCLDLLGTQRLYYALKNSDLEGKDELTSEVLDIAQQKIKNSLVIEHSESRRLRLLRLLPGHLVSEKSKIPKKSSQIFSYLEKFLKEKFPDAEAASPFTKAFGFFWAAELLSAELFMRRVCDATTQLEPQLDRITTALHNRQARAPRKRVDDASSTPSSED